MHDLDRVAVGDRDDLAGGILRSGEDGEGDEGGQDESVCAKLHGGFIGCALPEAGWCSRREPSQTVGERRMFGCDPLDALSRRVGIALTHGNHMHGCMCHHLVRWLAVLKPNRERVRLEPGKQPLADFGDQIPDGGAVLPG